MPTTLTEAGRLTTPEATKTGGRRWKARLIQGDIWGSSGYYPADVLEADGPTAWPAGTQVYLDHPGEAERYDRPERSVRDLAGRTTSTPVYEGDGLYAEVELYPHVAPIVEAMADDVGLSIRAAAEIEEGERDGRTGRIVTRLIEGVSIDVVTKAGAGGRLIHLVESARRESELVEASADQRSAELRDLVKATHSAGDREYAWLVDYDETARTVLYEYESADSKGTYRQTYTITADTATALVGDPVQVRRVVTYVPVTTTAAEAAAPDVPVNPAGQSTTPTSQEDTMPQIEEARLRQLEEAHGRVPALESERDTANARADAAEARALQAEAGTYARDFARNLVTKANPDLAEASVARIVRDAMAKPLPLEESGRLDTTAFTPTVEEARRAEETYLAQVAEASGVGSVRGVGLTHQQTITVTEADVEKAVAKAFGRKEA